MRKIKTIDDTSHLPEDPFLYDLQFSLREIQNSMGYTQEEISKPLHISRGHFINLVNGNATLSLEIAEQILFLLARYCSRRPWEEQELLKILRKNIRPQHPEDLYLFQSDSILECWERHFQISLPEEVQLTKLVPNYELLIDPYAFPAPAIRKLQPLADAIRQNNLLHPEDKPQKFTALRCNLEQLSKDAEKDSASEAALTKSELEHLSDEGVLEVFSTGGGSTSPHLGEEFYAYLISTDDFSSFPQSETAHIAVFSGSEEVALDVFHLNTAQSFKKSIHLFRYDPQTKKILEWIPADLHCTAYSDSKPIDRFLEIGGCAYPIRKTR